MNRPIEGIILSLKEYREYDMILQVLTKEDGLQSFVAKGIRKLQSKNAAVCQRFTQALFHVDFKEQQTIHGMRTADLIESYRKLRENLIKQSIASVLCDMILTFYHEDACELYADFSFTLEQLNKTDVPYAPAALFIVRLLSLQGMQPVVDQCVNCGRTDDICSFSSRVGGFLCSHCYDPQQQPIETKANLKCFRLLVLCDKEHYDLLEHYTDWTFHHFEVLYAFFEEYSGVRLKSMKFLRSIESMN